MDGLELARAIKADSAISSVRLILLTSIGQNYDAETMNRHGISAYLVKPALQSQLFNSITSVIAPSSVKCPPSTFPEVDKTKVMFGAPVLLVEDNAVNRKSRSTCSKTLAAASRWLQMAEKPSSNLKNSF